MAWGHHEQFGATVQHTHSTTSVNRVRAVRTECFMSPRILSLTPHGPMDASMLSNSRARLFQTSICADAGCRRLQPVVRLDLAGSASK